MTDFRAPDDITFNRGPIADPAAFARQQDAAGWLYMCGAEWAGMEGGMSFDQVQDAVAESVNVVSDPPQEMTVDLARDNLAALDRLPRPTLVTCRAGPRSSAIVYMHAGLAAGVSPDEVIGRAAADGAPFAGNGPIEDWVRQSMTALAAEG